MLEQYIVLWEVRGGWRGVAWRYSLESARAFIGSVQLASWVLYAGHGVTSVNADDLDTSLLVELDRSKTER